MPSPKKSPTDCCHTAFTAHLTTRRRACFASHLTFTKKSFSWPGGLFSQLATSFSTPPPYSQASTHSIMDHQDQRKRAFSQAFQRMNQLRQGDHNTKPAKRILSYPLGATDLRHQECDQENEAPLDLDTTAAFDEMPGTQIRHPLPVNLQYADPTLYDYASLQNELYANGPGPELNYESGSSPPPLLRDRKPMFPVRHDSLPTPPIVRGQSMFGPSPYVRPDLVESYGYSGTELSPMSDTSTAVGPVTPSALNFDYLTLNSQGHPLTSSPIRYGRRGGRTTVRVVPVFSFVRYVRHGSQEYVH